MVDYRYLNKKGTLLFAVFAVLLLLVAACGCVSGDDSNTVTYTTPDAKDQVTAVISSPETVKGDLFYVIGSAEGNADYVDTEIVSNGAAVATGTIPIVDGVFESTFSTSEFAPGDYLITLSLPEGDSVTLSFEIVARTTPLQKQYISASASSAKVAAGKELIITGGVSGPSPWTEVALYEQKDNPVFIFSQILPITDKAFSLEIDTTKLGEGLYQATFKVESGESSRVEFEITE